MSRRTARLTRVAFAAGLLAAVGLLPVAAGGPVAASSAGSAFTATKTVTRAHLDATGESQTVESKKVTVHVDHTKDLYGRQNVNVTWSGAQPTGGLQPDVNGAAADQQEYPMVLLECRGRDSSDVPSSQQVSPETCWTHGPDERYQGVSYTNFAPWRLDRYETTPDRAAVVGRPALAEADCGDPAANERWTPFVAADGTRYYYGNQSCAGIPPEDYNSDTSQQVVPQNATFAATATDGSGSAKFDVWTEAEDQSLGCSATVACTLEVIPIMGVSCDPYGVSPVAHDLPADDVPSAGSEMTRAISDCEAGGAFAPGEIATGSQPPNLAVTGALWWSASNWRNRIAVPLSFAPVSKACEQVGGGAPVPVYGSEVLADATNQWAPAFCLNPKLFNLTHVQTGEPLAQSLLNDPTSDVGAAFATDPPDGGFARPVVQAPVAVSGFSISYTIDDAQGNPVTTLRLDARLLAKLLTESYPGDDFNRFAAGQFPYLAHNPINITYDPEFQALNPGIAEELNGNAGPAALIALSSQSDVIDALTSYLNADPAARAWLDGKPDPWGMVVNPAYKGISLPVLQWPLRDTTLPNFGSEVKCTQLDPAPWLPLVASPTPTLATTTLDVQFAASPGRVTCTPIGDPNNPANVSYQWSSLGRQQPGQRFVIGITTIGDAARYDLNSALLQTTSSIADTAKFTSAAGRTFAGPTRAAMSAAAAKLRPSPSLGTWTMPYGALAKTSTAYPGTMLVSADVLTTGLSKSIANDFANLLTFAAGSGQKTGTGNGQLPVGYLPMTAANKLGGLADYTRTAAAAVRHQTGTVPPLHPSSTPSGGSSTRGHSGAGGSSTPAPLVGGLVGSTGTGAATPAGAAAAVARPGARAAAAAGGSGTPALAAQTIRTPAFSLGFGGVFLPLLFGVGVLGSLLAGATVWAPQRVGRKHRRSR